jgi:hypothetical protein
MPPDQQPRAAGRRTNRTSPRTQARPSALAPSSADDVPRTYVDPLLLGELKPDKYQHAPKQPNPRIHAGSTSLLVVVTRQISGRLEFCLWRVVGLERKIGDKVLYKFLVPSIPCSRTSLILASTRSKQASIPGTTARGPSSSRQRHEAAVRACNGGRQAATHIQFKLILLLLTTYSVFFYSLLIICKLILLCSLNNLFVYSA